VIGWGEQSRQLGPSRSLDRFQYGTRPCLMTRKLIRGPAARHHSIPRNTSGQGDEVSSVFFFFFFFFFFRFWLRFFFLVLILRRNRDRVGKYSNLRRSRGKFHGDGPSMKARRIELVGFVGSFKISRVYHGIMG
jgi:hypothetical protein